MTKLRLYAGVALLVLAFIMPFFGFAVAATNLSLAAKAALIGALTVGGPEVLAVAAVALLGKEAFQQVTGGALLLLKRLMPRGSVSITRYRIGLCLFILPFVPAYIQGYAPQLLPDSSPMRLYVNIVSDLMFVTSLFVLGGDFWDKLRSLFVYDARAQFPQDPRAESASP